jgi:hypothetical protein
MALLLCFFVLLVMYNQECAPFHETDESSLPCSVAEPATIFSKDGFSNSISANEKGPKCWNMRCGMTILAMLLLLPTAIFFLGIVLYLADRINGTHTIAGRS